MRIDKKVLKEDGDYKFWMYFWVIAFVGQFLITLTMLLVRGGFK